MVCGLWTAGGGAVIVRPEHIKRALLNLGLLTEPQLARALQEYQAAGGRFGQVLVRLGFLKDEQVADAILPQIGLLPDRLGAVEIPPALIAKVPAAVAVNQRIVPVKETPKGLVLATDTPLTFLVLDHLAATIGCAVDVTLTTAHDLDALLGTHYRQASAASAAVAAVVPQAAEAAPRVDMKLDAAADNATEGPIIQLVSLLFADAVKRRASDIHVEPLADRVRVRFRIDGVLQEVTGPAKSLQGPLTSRIKIMAGMDIADAFHLALSGKASRFLTFDAALARRAGKLGTQPPASAP